MSTTVTFDRVFIEALEIETIIGIFDWERTQKQIVSLDLEMNADITRASLTDHIDDTLNYKEVAKRLIGFIEQSEFQLVETLAQRCADIILNEFPVQWLSLRVSKPGAVRGSRAVGVMIERSRSGWGAK